MPVHDYIPLTQEQIARAQQTDLVSWLQFKGEPIRKEGKNYIWLRHDSVRIQGHKWIQNSTGEQGGAVHFLEHFYGMYFPDAVLELIGESLSTYIPVSTSANPVPQSELQKAVPVYFELPKRNTDMKRTYAYLTKTRGIDSDVFSHFVELGALYEDTKHNVVFVGFDKRGTARFAHLKSTNTYTSGFRIDQDGSDKRYPFASVGTSPTLFIFEAAIDLMSYICLHKNYPWHNDSFIAMGGFAPEAIAQFLLDHPFIANISFCLDNDFDAKRDDGTPDQNHGQVMAEKLRKEYKQKGYCCKITKPVRKDWNELLLAVKSGIIFDRSSL